MTNMMKKEIGCPFQIFMTTDLGVNLGGIGKE